MRSRLWLAVFQSSPNTYMTCSSIEHWPHKNASANLAHSKVWLWLSLELISIRMQKSSGFTHFYDHKTGSAASVVHRSKSHWLKGSYFFPGHHKMFVIKKRACAFKIYIYQPLLIMRSTFILLVLCLKYLNGCLPPLTFYTVQVKGKNRTNTFLWPDNHNVLNFPSLLSPCKWERKTES